MKRGWVPWLLAGVAIVAIAVVAALLNDEPIGRPPEQPSAAAPQSTPAGTPSPTPTPTPASDDPVLAIARRYALAARNWSADTYRTAWERQLRLAAGDYRRALLRAPPDRAQLDALRADDVANLAVVEAAQREPDAPSGVARVTVWLSERSELGSRLNQRVSRNEIRLERRGGRWLVVGWTTIPGAAARSE